MTGLRHEREIKIPVTDLDRVRERLRAAGAELERAACSESNWVFDRRDVPAGESLRSRRELLRLRTDGSGSRLTYKSAPRMRGSVKERDEHEVAVDEPAQARRLLEALGFEVTARYEKVRECWLLLGCEVALDRTPIGDFVEIEQIDPHLPPGGIEQVSRRCGLDPERAEEMDYLALYRDHRSRHEGLPADMVFERRPDLDSRGGTSQ